MKLKRKISQSELEQLTKELQELYTKVGDEFVLNLDDTAFEQLKAEKKAKDEELAKYKAEEEQRIKEAEERAEKRAKEKYEKAKTDKDVEAIEKAWQDKYEKQTAELEASKSQHQAFVRTSLIDGTVTAITGEIATVPKLLAPHIKSRLDVDFTGAEPKLIVLDESGQRSALTVDELKKSFIDNKDFSSIIKASTPTGGAKAGVTEKTTNPSGAKGEMVLNNMSDEQLAQYATKFSQGNE